MRKLSILTLSAIATVAFIGGAQAMPLSASGTLATSGTVEQALPDQGATQVRWHGRSYHHHYNRGYHYGWYPRRHHHHHRAIVIYR